MAELTNPIQRACACPPIGCTCVVCSLTNTKSQATLISEWEIQQDKIAELNEQSCLQATKTLYSDCIDPWIIQEALKNPLSEASRHWLLNHFKKLYTREFAYIA